MNQTHTNLQLSLYTDCIKSSLHWEYLVSITLRIFDNRIQVSGYLRIVRDLPTTPQLRYGDNYWVKPDIIYST